MFGIKWQERSNQGASQAVAVGTERSHQKDNLDQDSQWLMFLKAP